MSTPNYYEILGVPLKATAAQIRTAHRAQSRRYHPDTADDRRGDPALFAQVQEAYETLSVPDFRRRYDTKQAAARGEIPARGPRRPPKSPCGACKKSVYASQLYSLPGPVHVQGRASSRRQRDARRPRLTGMSEFRWRLRRLGVWAQSHMATIAVVLLATGAGRPGWPGSDITPITPSAARQKGLRVARVRRRTDCRQPRPPTPPARQKPRILAPRRRRGSSRGNAEC